MRKVLCYKHWWFIVSNEPRELEGGDFYSFVRFIFFGKATYRTFPKPQRG